MASLEYISLETTESLMKHRLFSFELAPAPTTLRGNVTLRIPGAERRLKTSDLHISLVRHGYIAVDATAAEPYDAN
jgi:hypothetical protein